MTWTSIDDGLNHNPQTRPGAVGNTALGLWVRLCVFTAEQMRYHQARLRTLHWERSLP